MPKCSICGRQVRSGEVLHVKCREKWEAEVREELERERKSFVVTLEERERVLDEREEMMRKREENVLDREEELDIREEAAEVQFELLKELIEEERAQLQRARWFLWINSAAAAFWICWGLIKIIAR
jgi:hypothetical protein